MLTSIDFKNQSIELVSKWNNINNINNDSPPWQWIQAQQLNNESKGYLTTKRYHTIIDNSRENEVSHNDNNEFEEIIEDIDDAIITNNKENENNIIIFQYDIIYSKSYQVPVLYLNAFYSENSSPLSWDDIWNNLPLSNFDKDQQSTIPYITQVEHPIIGNPCYQLHPCETDNLMKLILLKQQDEEDKSKKEYLKEHYLLSWLSIIGPMVNIKIPIELLKIK